MCSVGWSIQSCPCTAADASCLGKRTCRCLGKTRAENSPQGGDKMESSRVSVNSGIYIVAWQSASEMVDRKPVQKISTITTPLLACPCRQWESFFLSNFPEGTWQRQTVPEANAGRVVVVVVGINLIFAQWTTFHFLQTHTHLHPGQHKALPQFKDTYWLSNSRSLLPGRSPKGWPERAGVLCSAPYLRCPTLAPLPVHNEFAENRAGGDSRLFATALLHLQYSPPHCVKHCSHWNAKINYKLFN